MKEFKISGAFWALIVMLASVSPTLEAQTINPPPVPIDCNLSCPVTRGGIMNTVKWSGIVTSFLPPYFVPVSSQQTPAWVVQMGYLSVGPPAAVTNTDPTDYIYRFRTTNSGYVCYDYNNLTFTNFGDAVLPTQTTDSVPNIIWDLHVSNFTERRLIKVEVLVLANPWAPDHHITYFAQGTTSPIYLSATPTLAEAKLGDTAAWPNDLDYLADYGLGVYYEGIPFNSADGKFVSTKVSTVQCPGDLIPTMSSTVPDPTNATMIPVTVKFGEPVTGFSAGSVVPGNATVSGFSQVDNATGTFMFYLVPVNQGPVTADIPAAAAKDVNGNPCIAAVQFRRTFDSVRPNVTINQAASQSDPTTTSPINFTVTFSEPVTGFGTSCVNLNSAVGPVSATVSGSGSLYNVAVTGMNKSGAVTGTVSMGCAADAAGNYNNGSTSSDNTVVFAVQPVVGSVSVIFGPSGAYNLAGSTRNRLPWQITGIRIQFSSPVSSANINSLTGVTATAVSGLGTNTITWAIKPIALGNVSVSIVTSGTNRIQDILGQTPAPYTQAFRVLFADVNDDGVVDKTDMVTVNRGQDPPYSIFNDVSGDGVVDNQDASIVRSQLGAKLP